MDYVTIINYINDYLLTALGFWLGNSFIAGFVEADINKKDFYSALLWPIYTALFLGTLFRLFIEWIKTKKLKKEAK